MNKYTVKVTQTHYYSGIKAKDKTEAREKVEASEGWNEMDSDISITVIKGWR